MVLYDQIQLDELINLPTVKSIERYNKMIWIIQNMVLIIIHTVKQEISYLKILIQSELMTRLKLGRQFKEEEQEYVQIYDKQNDQLMWDVWDKKADWFLT